ncbi:hypothetical protein [sulfur-oxidizing endosymbiont of Gigantopelta aegis]|uniref:hypothetical protein n=1 Tax=sulfur-oxidizing endosymbiont of Gigantopelta aegis TaxID=2794934 RepID=UPI001BE41A32|nr:hypothetical protein [sulfur-oxidizing endosymbiont of Gigantopelta aegis]
MMHRANIISSLLFLLISFPVLSIAASFKDSFESADMSSTDANGFKWSNLNRTSIVTQHPTEGNTVLFNGKSIYNSVNDGRDWTAYSGDNSLRFYYKAGQAQSEQRFDLGSAYPELWLKFWVRVPQNFTFGPVSGPNKFFSIWSDGYSAKGDGSSVWLSMSRSKDGTGADLWFSYSAGGYKGSGGARQRLPFISTQDRGRWMQIVWHVKVESSPGASDGIVQTYRRWANETTYTKLHEALNAVIKVPDNNTPAGLKSGYILGWANAAYTENTEWLLDDFEVSDKNLLDTTPDNPTPPNDKEPPQATVISPAHIILFRNKYYNYSE